jgi:pimeloyl-ACP methyl ester carboxylesterase
MSHKPTLVLVPGAWHSTDTWNKISSLLKAQQYKCVPVALPSTAGNASATFGEDIEAVRESIIAETTHGRDVVVVVHSYGGAVGQSAIKGLTRPKQDSPSLANDSSGHVIGLAVMASGFGQTGVSFIDGLGGKPPPSWRTDPSGFAIIVVPPRELFYHDLSEEEGDYWVSKLEKQSLKSLMEGGEHSYSGWMDVPVWFLATTEDKAFPVQAQRMLAQAAKDAGGDITMREVESSHSPMLSRPKETVDFILEAVASFIR